MARLTVPLLKKFAPGGAATILAGIVQYQDMLLQYGVDSPLRLSHFMGQFFAETRGLASLEENLNYTTAKRIRAVFGNKGKRFATDASAQPYVKNPRALANKVYGGRLGNKGADDGWRYRGSGPLQTTGLSNFREVQTATGLPVVANPEILRTLPGGLQAALIYWQTRGCARYADQDNATAVGGLINTGSAKKVPLGNTERLAAVAKAKKVFGAGHEKLDLGGTRGTSAFAAVPVKDGSSQPLPVAIEPDEMDATARAGRMVAGPSGSAQLGESDAPAASEAEQSAFARVGADNSAALANLRDRAEQLSDATKIVPSKYDPATIQQRLRDLGYYMVGRVDGEPGDMVADAIMSFRRTNGLPLSDQVDDQMTAVLFSPDAVRKPVPESRANATRADLAEGPFFKLTTKVRGALAAIGVGSVAAPAADGIVNIDPQQAGGWLDIAGRVGSGLVQHWPFLLIGLIVVAAWWFIHKADSHEVEGYREGRHV